MSHVATIDLDVKDLDCLALACGRLGLEFRPNQKKYRWYGDHVGDYPLPHGFAEEDMGHCDHAIAVPNSVAAYEIGVVKRRDGREGYTLLWDFYCGGFGLQERVGDGCTKLKQAYAAEVTIKQARLQGFGAREEQRADGSIRLTLTR